MDLMVGRIEGEIVVGCCMIKFVIQMVISISRKKRIPTRKEGPAEGTNEGVEVVG